LSARRERPLPMNAEPPIYGLLAEFETPEALVEATQRARQEGYTKLEAYSPFSIEELSSTEAPHRTAVPKIMLLGGCLGAAGAFLMQYYSAAIDYPFNIGGRPPNSWPAFIPVTFELTVLTSALFGLVGMLALNGLPMPYHPLFNVPEFARASQDRFFLCIEAMDPKFDAAATRQFLSGFNPVGLTEVPP
jgi:hypothetical protein